MVEATLDLLDEAYKGVQYTEVESLSETMPAQSQSYAEFLAEEK